MMKLLLRKGEHEGSVEWSQYALLRDNVQHYLEFGQPRNSFTALHTVESAVDGEQRRVRAQELRQEVKDAWEALAGVTLEQSAVSLRTRAIMTGCEQAPQVRGTVVARLAGWELPVRGSAGQPLRELLRGFVEVVLSLTANAGREDDLVVQREGRLGGASQLSVEKVV
jgi:hypothetical protein